MCREVDAILADIWDWAEEVRRCVAPARWDDGSGDPAVSSLVEDVTRGVVAGLVGPIAAVVEAAARRGDPTPAAAVRDLFELP